jgi:uncharacterized membrane protein
VGRERYIAFLVIRIAVLYGMSNPQESVEALRAELAALRARIDRLEQRSGIAATVPPEPPIKAAETATPLVIPMAPPARPESTTPLRSGTAQPAAAVPRKREPEALESKIGKLWLNRIGIFAILIGVSYFIKYALDNGWIGPTGQIALGLLAGIAVLLWSERFRNRGYAAFSYSLKAVGIGVLYLSLWGAFQVYHLIPSGVAFAAMLLVTGFTMTLAITQDAEILAGFALIGGFSTPALLSTGQNHEVVLFSYVVLLDLGMLVMVAFKPWRRLLVGSFIGTATMYVGWFINYYSKDQRATTVLFTLLFGVIFAVIPLITPLTKSRWHGGFSVTLTLLPLVNAAAFFLALYLMYDRETVRLTWYALALAAAYLVLSSQFKRRVGSEPEVVKTINLLHVAIAIAFITIAVPLKLNAHWITIGWLVESAVLLLVAVRTRVDFLRYFASATLVLGIVRLLIIDNFYTQRLIFNARFASYLVAIAILGGIVAAGERFASEREMRWIQVAGVALNMLALIGLTLEASDYFSRQVTAWYQTHSYNEYTGLRQIMFERRFSYSAIWLIYGAGLMMFGFWKRSAFVRWQALALIAFTIVKVFVFDVSELEQGYRILSFIALGAVLMAISYVYHRDWLRLSSPPPEESREPA